MSNPRVPFSLPVSLAQELADAIIVGFDEYTNAWRRGEDDFDEFIWNLAGTLYETNKEFKKVMNTLYFHLTSRYTPEEIIKGAARDIVNEAVVSEASRHPSLRVVLNIATLLITEMLNIMAVDALDRQDTYWTVAE